MKQKRYGIRYRFNLILLTALSLTLAFFIIILYISNRWSNSLLHPQRIIPSGDLLIENNIPYNNIELTAKDGVTLAVWYTPPQNGAVILLAHGHGANRPGNMYVMFAKQGYGVLAWDFRAHGASGGKTSTLGYFEQLDVEAALDYALMQPDVSHIGAWGGSMGAATIILTAAKRPEIEAVVSDSAYPSLEEALKLNPNIEFLQPLLLYLGERESGAKFGDVNPVEEIGKISPRAIFVIDGWSGGAITMSSPYRLYNAANQPKEIWVEEKVPHMNMYSYFPEKYSKKAVGFFDKYLLGK